MPAPYHLMLQLGDYETLYQVLHARVRQWECQLEYLEDVAFRQLVMPESASADILAFDQRLLCPQTADTFTALSKDRRLLAVLDDTLCGVGAALTQDEVLDLVALCQRRTQDSEMRETLLRLKGNLYALLCP